MKNFLIALIALAVIGGGYLWWSSNNSAETATPNDTVVEETSQTPPGMPEGAVMEDGTIPEGSINSGTTYTMTQVSTHNTDDSCWSVIDGNVYDLTNWIGQHPGGAQAIAQLCGKDGTAAFHGQHGDRQQQATVLASFKIGALLR